MAQSYWRTIVGPLSTLATVSGIYILDRYLVPVPNPGAISFLAVVFSAYIGGIAPGLISAAISVGYAALSFSIPGQFLQFSPDNLARLYILLVATPAIALMVGMLQARAKLALRHEHAARTEVETVNGEAVALRSALDLVDYGIVLLDRELRAVFINRAFRTMVRLPDEFADRKPAFVGLMYHGRDTGAYAVPRDELAAYVAERTALVRAGDERPLDVQLANGDVFCIRCKVLPDGGRMLTYADVTEPVKDGLQQLATLDGMTGLNSKSHFLKLAEAEWSRFRRYGRPLSLLVLDVDRFKSVNDSHSPDVGDRVIIQVAEACLDKRDPDIAARTGGEEFAMLLPETNLEEACVVAERLRNAVAERTLTIDGRTLRVTISVGVAEASQAMSDIPDLLKQAYSALYEAKRTGRNRVCTSATKDGGTQAAKSSASAA